SSPRCTSRPRPRRCSGWTATRSDGSASGAHPRASSARRTTPSSVSSRTWRRSPSRTSCSARSGRRTRSRTSSWPPCRTSCAPRSGIVTWARVPRDRSLDGAAMARGLDVIERNARAQARLVDDLLDMSRIMTGKMRLDLRPVDVRSVIASALESNRGQAEKNAIELSWHAPASAPVVLADPDRLQQILGNLLTNAMKFTPHGGRIDVSVVELAQDIEIRVHDTGSGIDPAFLPHVFDRFRQADGSSTRTHRGLGLGLAI